jgi:hypothetical protein
LVLDSILLMAVDVMKGTKEVVSDEIVRKKNTIDI